MYPAPEPRSVEHTTQTATWTGSLADVFQVALACCMASDVYSLHQNQLHIHLFRGTAVNWMSREVDNQEIR